MYYKRYCVVLKKVIKEAKRQYYSQLLALSQNKVKMTWNIIKNETGRRSVTEQMPFKLSNNGTAVNLENEADPFNKYFVNTTDNLTYRIQSKMLLSHS
jgi:hypothetical protein